MSNHALKAPQSAALAVCANVTMTPSQPLPESSRLLLPLIDELRLACSLPALDADELAATVRIWAEVLFAEGVPPNQWRHCLIRCLRTRESSFAINVSELCKAWREIKPVGFTELPPIVEHRPMGRE